ncbi:MAG: acetyl-CoA C-acyltransferase, partial [Anaerolineales bacterium]
MALFTDPKYQHWDMMTAMNMGLTAEKLFARTDCTKADMEKWGLRSHQLATKAQEAGFFE